jgi:hypothetical protein
VSLTSGGSQTLTMRGVPDVSGVADPETGYDVPIDGTNTVIGGTSTVAPLWAGLIARINAAEGGPVGFINPQLYAATSALNDMTITEASRLDRAGMPARASVARTASRSPPCLERPWARTGGQRTRAQCAILHPLNVRVGSCVASIRSKRRCATVREMKEGPSRSAIRC